MDKLLLRVVPDVVESLGLSRSEVYALIQRGEMPAVRIGRSVRVPAAALARWVEERTEQTVG